MEQAQKQSSRNDIMSPRSFLRTATGNRMVDNSKSPYVELKKQADLLSQGNFSSLSRQETDEYKNRSTKSVHHTARNRNQSQQGDRSSMMSRQQKIKLFELTNRSKNENKSEQGPQSMRSETNVPKISEYGTLLDEVGKLNLQYINKNNIKSLVHYGANSQSL
jgi:hypothetical protein